jgi:hypothetical protein
MASGWAFLVARGRRQGYRARLVPGMLSERGLSGLVEDSTGQSAPGAGVVVRNVDTTHGQMAIAYRTHRIRPDDLDDARPVRDEHGRPLDIVYGFACLGAIGGAPDDADLYTAFEQARETYRCFLADEAGFVTQISSAFVLRTTLLRVAQPAARRPMRTRIRVTVAAAVSVAVAILALTMFRATAAPQTHGLAGTWTGTLQPVGPGAAPPRWLTLTIICPDQDCTQMNGELNDSRCVYRLVQERMEGTTLRATVSRAQSTRRDDCLADGFVSLSRTGDAARLDWYEAGADHSPSWAATLTAVQP